MQATQQIQMKYGNADNLSFFIFIEIVCHSFQNEMWKSSLCDMWYGGVISCRLDGELANSNISVVLEIFYVYTF